MYKLIKLYRGNTAVLIFILVLYICSRALRVFNVFYLCFIGRGASKTVPVQPAHPIFFLNNITVTFPFMWHKTQVLSVSSYNDRCVAHNFRRSTRQ
jgi:hypothetical protein